MKRSVSASVGLACLLAGLVAAAEPITDVDFLLFYNAEPDATEFTIPPRTRQLWEVVIDTAGLATDSELRRGGDAIALEGRSMLVLRAHSELDAEADPAVRLGHGHGADRPAAPRQYRRVGRRTESSG